MEQGNGSPQAAQDDTGKWWLAIDDILLGALAGFSNYQNQQNGNQNNNTQRQIEQPNNTPYYIGAGLVVLLIILYFVFIYKK